MLLLAHGLRERGHDQAIACPDESPLAERARQGGFRAVTFSRGAGLPLNIRTLRRGICGIYGAGFEVLHAHDGRSQTLSALASLGLTSKRVATRRVTFMPGRLGPRIGLHRIQYGPTCDAIVAVSDFIRNLLVHSGIPPAKIAVIRDGIEIPAQLPDPAARSCARAHWGLDRETFVIGHAGAFTAEKGQDVLLEALLKSTAPALGTAQLLLAGEGPERCSPRIAGLLGALHGRVRMAGWVDDLASFFAALDLYVMPSRAEGLGSSALLAMAHGLPVVASGVGGLPEVVEEGRTGWLVSPGSPGELAAALADAASDAERLRRFGANARERATAFSSDIMVRQTESLYLRLTQHAK